ncbi:MAG: nicotinamide mononucleotide transporter [Ekhidna sp.]|nr:nicotinamide mononucleotide transporter [Ekhidna sp.]MBC6409813.1 nicotinamide mononucleotide transporter [Ekhidna sp.]MBC6425645.1 nicotinamide mononucleotide transporter [Ekhidna sp.]
MSFLLTIEIVATATSLSYLFLLIRQNIWCWPLAFVSALLSIYHFYESKLYFESMLYGYYALVAVYGWRNWSRPKTPLKVSTWKPEYHIITILTGTAFSIGLGYFFETNTDADKPYLDAATTIFSFVASILEVRKILAGWIYWIIINGVTIGLYFSKSLHIYAALMVVYFVMSIIGYQQWRKDWLKTA